MTTPTYSEALNTIIDALELAQKTIVALVSELEEARAALREVARVADGPQYDAMEAHSVALAALEGKATP